MKDRFYVYVLFRPWNGVPFYVGKGSGNRWRDFSRKYNPYFKRIIDKANVQKMPVISIIIRNNLKEEQAFEIERALISAIGRKCHGGPLANATGGGEGTSGHTVCEAVKEKRRIDMKNLWTQEFREKMRNILLGNTHTKGRTISDAHKAKISAAGLGKKFPGRTLSDETKIKIGNALKGKKRSVEVCKKLSEISKNRQYSQKTREKMRLAKIGRNLPESHKEKIKMSLKKFSNSPEGKSMKSAAAKIRWANEALRRQQHST